MHAPCSTTMSPLSLCEYHWQCMCAHRVRAFCVVAVAGRDKWMLGASYYEAPWQDAALSPPIVVFQYTFFIGCLPLYRCSLDDRPSSQPLFMLLGSCSIFNYNHRPIGLLLFTSHRGAIGDVCNVKPWLSPLSGSLDVRFTTPDFSERMLGVTECLSACPECREVGS